MSLIELWGKNKRDLGSKRVKQIIAIAGDGQLKDDNAASREFREFLSYVPTEILERYIKECLEAKFDDSGMVLQDIVNQVGKRLGFQVTDGRYRGASNQIGFDGLWKLQEGYSIIVEVKTTDAYRIDLETLIEYKKKLIKNGDVSEEKSSILIAVGREDTGGLEAQIRGSKFAWDIRLISVDALTRLLKLKEEIEDPKIIKKICDILTPHEFTKIDGIIDLVFSAAEDVRQDEELSEEIVDKDRKPKSIPVSFREACTKRIQDKFGVKLLKQTRSIYKTPDNSTAFLILNSKTYERANQIYWFAFHQHQNENLKKFKRAYIALGCGSAEIILLLPFADFLEWLDGLNITKVETKFYWHIVAEKKNNDFLLVRKQGYNRVNITPHLLK